MQGGDTMALLNSLWPFFLMGGIFYYMLWRPQKREQQKRQDSLMMGGTVAFSIVLAVAIFMILPYYLSVFFT